MWKTADKVKIVYSASKYTYKGSKYPQAYVVTNKSQLDTAIRWAGSSIYDPVAKKYISVTPKIIETDNKGFTLTLGYAPGGACCGGKLSFCNCVIEKEGIDTFIVGINTEFLIDMLLDATMTKGTVQEEIIFAKDNGNLGAIAIGSKQYQELMADEAKRAEVASSKKTKNWIPGSVYSTLTQHDLYIGDFRDVVKIDTSDWRLNSLRFTFNEEGPKKPFTKVIYPDVTSPLEERIYEGLGWTNFQSCPSRMFTEEIIPYDANYNEKIKELVLKHISDYKNNYLSATTLIEVAFRFYDNDPEFTKKCLPYVIKLINEPSKYTSTYKYYEINWGSTHVILNTWEEFINKLIELC